MIKRNKMRLIKITTKISTATNKAIRNLNYHHNHKNKALQALFNIEKYNSKKLSRQQKKIANDYSIEVLGSKKYAPWLYVYTLIKGEFVEGWIPDNFFGKVVWPQVNKVVGEITNLKTFTNLLLSTKALPDIGYYIDGVFYDRGMSILNFKSLHNLNGRLTNEVFIKPDGSNKGRGIIKVKKEEIDEDLYKRIGNCVIQESIKQHEFFDRMVNGTVATIRITTVKENSGLIDMRAAFLKLYRSNYSWFRQENNVKVAIINKNGDLDSHGYTPDWRRWSSHPDTNFPFANERIPKFKEAVSLCLDLHRKIPHLSIIGWDVIISVDETVKIIEWNGNHPDIKFSEATTGPCFTGLDWEKLNRKSISEYIHT